MNISKIKRIIKEEKLYIFSNLFLFINENWGKYTEEELRKIAEYANADRQKTAAYYTDRQLISALLDNLPILKQKSVSILEPSAGTGNFILPIIDKFSKIYKKIDITVNDIDSHSLAITKLFLSKHRIPSGVHISYTNNDFLDALAYSLSSFDYIIGNPPFLKISKRKYMEYGYKLNNLESLFFIKALSLAKVVSLILPKNALSTKEFKSFRHIVNNYNINSIIDFGESGFKGVLIETIALTVSKCKYNEKVKIINYKDKELREVEQSYITDSIYPSWLIYRNCQFDKIAANMTFDVFTVFRDRQITNKVLSYYGDVRVIKSRNISIDGKKLIDIPGYDRYISFNVLDRLIVKKYYKSKSVYLVPNMTYYPRMIKKQGNYVVNGSVAVLTLKPEYKISKSQMRFFSTNTFRDFYKIARNRGTRSLNIDSTSVFWFGIYNDVR